MRHLTAAFACAALAALLATSACSDVPGAVAGEPCNANGVCATGLICDVDNICRDESGPGPSASWKAMRLPDDKTLYGVWGRSASDVVAVGAGGNVLTYDGNATDDFAFAARGITTNTLYGVWGSGQQYWVVGQSAALYYDGSSWIDVSKLWDTANGKELNASYTLKAVHGDGKTGAVYAVGRISSSTFLVVKWSTGSRRWEIVDAGLSFSGEGVLVLGTQVWIVGSAQHVKHYNNQSWVEQNLPENAALNAIWSNGSRLAAVGPAGQLYQYGNQGWAVQDDVRANTVANGLWGDNDKLYVVGAYDYQDDTSIQTCSNVCRNNVVEEKVRSKTLYGIWGAGSTLFAVGASGTIVRYSE